MFVCRPRRGCECSGSAESNGSPTVLKAIAKLFIVDVASATAAMAALVINSRLVGWLRAGSREEGTSRRQGAVSFGQPVLKQATEFCTLAWALRVPL
jgi:hypothetical protein